MKVKQTICVKKKLLNLNQRDMNQNKGYERNQLIETRLKIQKSLRLSEKFVCGNPSIRNLEVQVLKRFTYRLHLNVHTQK